MSRAALSAPSPRRRRPDLTLRGRGMVGAGIAILGCGLYLGQRDLTRLAVLVLALPVVSLVLALLDRPRLTATRVTPNGNPTVGQPATITLTVRNDGQSADSLLAYDPLPAPLGVSPRFSLQRLPRGGQQVVSYTVTPGTRGRFRVGPLRAVVTDPLGLATVVHRVGGATEMIVCPQVVPFTGALLDDGTGADSTGRQASAGDRSLSVREYRHGDDLRRVHWRSTARRGDLMVRTDEHTPLRRATVVLDNRPGAHGTPADLEVAISLAASVCAHLAGRGFTVSLMTGEPSSDRPSPDQPDDPLVTLALLTPGDADALGRAVRAIDPTDDRLILITGGGDLTDLRRVQQPHAVVLHRQADTSGMRQRGWTTVAIPPGAGVAQIWQAAGLGVLDEQGVWA